MSCGPALVAALMLWLVWYMCRQQNIPLRYPGAPTVGTPDATISNIPIEFKTTNFCLCNGRSDPCPHEEHI